MSGRTPPPSGIRRHAAAVALVVGAAMLLALGDGIAKLLTQELHPAQIVWARFMFFFIPMAAALGPRRCATLLGRDRFRLQALRGLLSVGSAGCMIVALKFISLAQATALVFTAPAWIILLSALLLKQKITPHAAVAVAMGFVGVLVIVRPGGSALSWYLLLPLVTAFLFALYQIVTAVLSRTSSSVAILFHTGLVGAATTTLAVPFFWLPPSLTGWTLLVGAGLLNGAAHYLLTRAFASAPSALLAPFLYCQLLGAIGVGYALFGNVPDWPTWLGSGLIIASSLVVLGGAHLARRGRG